MHLKADDSETNIHTIYKKNHRLIIPANGEFSDIIKEDVIKIL